MHPLTVRIRENFNEMVQIMDTRDITTPNMYISQEIYETCIELGLTPEDASYMVDLYNQDLLFWGTGYYAEMRGIRWEIWKRLEQRFEVK